MFIGRAKYFQKWDCFKASGVRIFCMSLASVPKIISFSLVRNRSAKMRNEFEMHLGNAKKIGSFHKITHYVHFVPRKAGGRSAQKCALPCMRRLPADGVHKLEDYYTCLSNQNENRSVCNFRPKMRRLGHLPVDGVYKPENYYTCLSNQNENLKILRFEAPLHFANVDTFKEEVNAVINSLSESPIEGHEASGLRTFWEEEYLI